MPISIFAYDYTVINRSLPWDSQLKGGNEFLYESLALLSSAVKVDKNMDFTMNLGFFHQLQIKFP